MKNIKTITVTAILMGIISVTSCKKDVELQKENPVVPGSATSFKEMKVSPTFDWKSTSNVILNIAAANTPVTISNTLEVKTETGVIIYKKLQKMNEAFTTNIVLPSSLKRVVISFGSIVKTVDINNNKIDFNFITETTIIE